MLDPSGPGLGGEAGGGREVEGKLARAHTHLTSPHLVPTPAFPTITTRRREKEIIISKLSEENKRLAASERAMAKKLEDAGNAAGGLPARLNAALEEIRVERERARKAKEEATKQADAAKKLYEQNLQLTDQNRELRLKLAAAQSVVRTAAHAFADHDDVAGSTSRTPAKGAGGGNSRAMNDAASVGGRSYRTARTGANMTTTAGRATIGGTRTGTRSVFGGTGGARSVAGSTMGASTARKPFAAGGAARRPGGFSSGAGSSSSSSSRTAGGPQGAAWEKEKKALLAKIAALETSSSLGAKTPSKGAYDPNASTTGSVGGGYVEGHAARRNSQADILQELHAVKAALEAARAEKLQAKDDVHTMESTIGRLQRQLRDMGVSVKVTYPSEQRKEENPQSTLKAVYVLPVSPRAVAAATGVEEAIAGEEAAGPAARGASASASSKAAPASPARPVASPAPAPAPTPIRSPAPAPAPAQAMSPPRQQQQQQQHYASPAPAPPAPTASDEDEYGEDFETPADAGQQQHQHQQQASTQAPAPAPVAASSHAYDSYFTAPRTTGADAGGAQQHAPQAPVLAPAPAPTAAPAPAPASNPMTFSFGPKPVAGATRSGGLADLFGPPSSSTTSAAHDPFAAPPKYTPSAGLGAGLGSGLGADLFAPPKPVHTVAPAAPVPAAPAPYSSFPANDYSAATSAPAGPSHATPVAVGSSAPALSHPPAQAPSQAQASRAPPTGRGGKPYDPLLDDDDDAGGAPAPVPAPAPARRPSQFTGRASALAGEGAYAPSAATTSGSIYASSSASSLTAPPQPFAPTTPAAKPKGYDPLLDDDDDNAGAGSGGAGAGGAGGSLYSSTPSSLRTGGIGGGPSLTASGTSNMFARPPGQGLGVGGGLGLGLGVGGVSSTVPSSYTSPIAAPAPSGTVPSAYTSPGASAYSSSMAAASADADASGDASDSAGGGGGGLGLGYLPTGVGARGAGGPRVGGSSFQQGITSTAGTSTFARPPGLYGAGRNPMDLFS